MADDSELDPNTLWQLQSTNAVYEFAERCRQFHETNPFEQNALETMMVGLATELWDRKFSQAEIRRAFDMAVSLLKPYAAGEERRGDVY